MAVKSLIPNTLSCANLLCGCAAAVYAINGELFTAAVLILIASVFDLLDGFMARLLNATSSIGEQLDSLADVVTFGVAPGMIVFSILTNVENHLDWLPFVAFIIPLCSALRLARFNANKEESESFIGLATPANSIFWALLIIISHWMDGSIPPSSANGFHATAILNDPALIIAICVVLSLLMVSRIPMFSFKLKNLRWTDNRPQYLLALFVVIAIVLFKAAGLLLVIPLYILISVIQYLFFRRNEVQSGN